MHVIWKRPDGFHEASPTDYIVLQVNTHAKLWLHKKDKDSYPFRISGGWEEKENSVKLNNFINLIPAPKDVWVDFLLQLYDHSMKSDAEQFFEDTFKWLGELKGYLKGDTWEVEIAAQAIALAQDKLSDSKGAFLASVEKNK
jgi:hypothetical protein